MQPARIQPSPDATASYTVPPSDWLPQLATRGRAAAGRTSRCCSQRAVIIAAAAGCDQSLRLEKNVRNSTAYNPSATERAADNKLRRYHKGTQTIRPKYSQKPLKTFFLPSGSRYQNFPKPLFRRVMVKSAGIFKTVLTSNRIDIPPMFEIPPMSV